MRRWMMVFVLVFGLIASPASVWAQQTKKTAPAQAGNKGATKTPPKKATPKEKADGKEKAPAAKVPMAKIQPARATESVILKHVPDEVFIVAAIQPSKLINANLLRQSISKAGGDDVVDDVLKQATRELLLDPSQIVEAGFFIDNQMLEKMRTEFAESRKRVELKKQIMQLVLSMHNFHDTHESFPNSDGFEESKGNLSWRVHMLPFLDEVELYEEFHLDEPWDSEHNKALIKRMPDAFKVDGVKDPGKTCIHVLTGPGMPFGGKKPISFRDVTDGTSNTIMTVLAGPDTAEVWTKPGGLEIDPEDPLKALGNVEKKFVVGFMDGSVREISADVDEETFLHAAQHQDNQIVDLPYESSGPSMPTPGLIVRYAEDFNQDEFIQAIPKSKEPEAIEIDGHPAFRIHPDASIMFVDGKTMLWGSEDVLKTMVAKHDAAGDVKKEFQSLFPKNDGAIVSRLDLEDEEIKTMFQGTPFLGMLQNLTKATVLLNATGDGESLLAATVETENPQTAQQITGLLNGGYQIFKGQFLSEISQEQAGVSEDVIAVLTELVDSVTIKADDAAVKLDIPKIEDPEKLMADLEPALKEVLDGIRTSRARAKEFEKLNSIRQIGLALHNYHDVYNGFPSWNTPQGKGDNQGLSWRVYLLPYIDEGALYEQFHLDEPWDSEHNKTLIEKMPKIFKSAEVEEPGKTSFHVFLGEKTPFGSDERKKLHHITDGTSNTLMVVQAGPDKAEIWTKPSGLEYDPENPKDCLGKVGDQIMIQMCDGFAKFIDSNVDDATFLRMIEHNDGEPVTVP